MRPTTKPEPPGYRPPRDARVRQEAVVADVDDEIAAARRHHLRN
jgi:hypothetical protein